MNEVKSNTIDELIEEGLSVGKVNVEVTIPLPLDSRGHYSAILNILLDGPDIIRLKKDKKIQSIKWI